MLFKGTARERHRAKSHVTSKHVAFDALSPWTGARGAIAPTPSHLPLQRIQTYSDASKMPLNYSKWDMLEVRTALHFRVELIPTTAVRRLGRRRAPKCGQKEHDPVCNIINSSLSYFDLWPTSDHW